MNNWNKKEKKKVVWKWFCKNWREMEQKYVVKSEYEDSNNVDVAIQDSRTQASVKSVSKPTETEESELTLSNIPEGNKQSCDQRRILLHILPLQITD